MKKRKKICEYYSERLFMPDDACRVGYGCNSNKAISYGVCGKHLVKLHYPEITAHDYPKCGCCGNVENCEYKD